MMWHSLVKPKFPAQTNLLLWGLHRTNIIPGSTNVEPRKQTCRMIHEYRTIRKYQGPLKAVIFDWAGTVVDCGSRAPVETFCQIFEEEGITITEDEARGPMGVDKKLHIEKILKLDRVLQKWKSIKDGQLPTNDDLNRMYNKFVPIQLRILPQFSGIIDGATETLSYLRTNWHLKIGSTTGYPKVIVDILKDIAAAQGYVADSYVAADEVPSGRPYPHMVWLNAIRLDVHPMQAIIKVDDTVDGIREGLAAGCWTVGVSLTGNYVGASAQQLAAMSESERVNKVKMASEILSEAGAHFVVESVRDLPNVIEQINHRMSLGLTP